MVDFILLSHITCPFSGEGNPPSNQYVGYGYGLGCGHGSLGKKGNGSGRMCALGGKISEEVTTIRRREIWVTDEHEGFGGGVELIYSYALYMQDPEV